MIEYRDIAGFSDYMISNTGKVFSKHVSRDIGYYINHGYPHVHIKNDTGEWKYVKIHRLVATAFLEKLSDKLVCNHINGIKTDNNVTNLEWVTSSYNNKHAYDTGLKQISRKSRNKCDKHPCAKLTKSDIEEIHKLLNDNVFQKDIAVRFNVTQSTISMIKHNKTWQEVK